MWGNLLIKMLDRLVKRGALTLAMPNGEIFRFGDGTTPSINVRITDVDLPLKLLKNPELAMGEAYMDGTLIIKDDDVRGFLKLVIANHEDGNLPGWQKLIKSLRIAKRVWDQWIPQKQAKSNAEHHYDISTDFYYLFLDEDRQYTCAYFKEADDTLEQAQINKKRHIGDKLLIEPGMKVLDIGSGWGGLAITLAKDYGAHVVGVTLSEEQLKAARIRAEDAGVSDKVEFRLTDYRNVDEKFDRIVSVGMLEHVGQPQYATYFSKIDQNLADDGVALVHFIGRTSPPGNLSPWFQKYIFPGGYTPALSEVLQKVEKTGLQQTDVEVWRTHYDRTLNAWLQRFEARLPEVRAMGYDERFIRMWRYYLIASELSMSDMPHVLFHLQLAKHQDIVPVTRDYLYTESAEKIVDLRAAE